MLSPVLVLFVVRSFVNFFVSLFVPHRTAPCWHLLLGCSDSSSCSCLHRCGSSLRAPGAHPRVLSAGDEDGARHCVRAQLAYVPCSPRPCGVGDCLEVLGPGMQSKRACCVCGDEDGADGGVVVAPNEVFCCVGGGGQARACLWEAFEE